MCIEHKQAIQPVSEKKAKTSKKNEVSANIYHLTVAFYALVKEQTFATSCEEEDNRQKLMPVYVPQRPQLSFLFALHYIL